MPYCYVVDKRIVALLLLMCVCGGELPPSGVGTSSPSALFSLKHSMHDGHFVCYPDVIALRPIVV